MVVQWIIKHLLNILAGAAIIVIIVIVIYLGVEFTSTLDDYAYLSSDSSVEGKKEQFYNEYIEQEEANQEAIASGDSAAGTSTVTGSSGGSGGSGGSSGVNNPPDSNSISDPDSTAASDIKKGLYTQEDYNYMCSLIKESTSYEGYYAVCCCVRNRVNASNSSVKAIVTASGQFQGYVTNGYKKASDAQKKAAILVLRGSDSTIGASRYFFGRVNGYCLWAESGVSFYNVGGNIYYAEYGKVHNKKETHNTAKGDILIYDSHNSVWVYDSGTYYTAQ